MIAAGALEACIEKRAGSAILARAPHSWHRLPSYLGMQWTIYQSEGGFLVRDCAATNIIHDPRRASTQG